LSLLKNRLTKNSLWMILSRFAAQGLAVIFTILLARRLGAAEFGAYAFIVAIVFVANALTTFGTDMSLIREIAAKDDLTGLPAALILQLVLSIIFIALVWIFAAWIPNQSQETIEALKVYSFSLIPLAFFSMFTIALRGKQLMDIYALLNIVVSLLQVFAVLILRENNLVLLASFLVFVQVVAALFAGLLCSYIIPRFWDSWRLSSLRDPLGGAFLISSSFLKAVAPIALLAVLTILYQRLSVTMLSLMTSPSDAGIFSAAVRIVEASKTAHIAVFAALYPAMANVMSLRGVALRATRETSAVALPPSAGSSTWRHNLFELKHLRFLVTGAIFISLALFVFAAPLVNLLYGDGFILSRTSLQILAWALIPFTINTYLTLSFLASKQEGLVGRGLMASLLGLLILNLWWIPIRGSEGAAWASLAAECLQSIVLLISTRSVARVRGEAHEFPQLS
jgi:O-antigen/teichoic acid export membrane protein